MGEYELTRAVWAVDRSVFPADGSLADKLRFLLRYAILAPSSHNSQPWRFAVRPDGVNVFAEESRWLPEADPTKRELYVSVGCAVENLCVSAEAFGFRARVDRRPDGPGDLAARVTVDDAAPDSRRPPGLFDHVTDRYTSHAPFADRPLPDEAVTAFRDATPDGVALEFVTDAARTDALAALQVEADEALMDDPAYRRELAHWVGLGALGDSWLAARVGQTVLTHLDLGPREARKNAELLRGASAIGVLATPSDDGNAWLETGQAYERLALQAAGRGIAVHPVSQTLERLDTRRRLGDLLDVDGYPQHLFRLGYDDGPAEHTPRWPLEKFLA